MIQQIAQVLMACRQEGNVNPAKFTITVNNAGDLSRLTAILTQEAALLGSAPPPGVSLINFKIHDTDIEIVRQGPVALQFGG